MQKIIDVCREKFGNGPVKKGVAADYIREVGLFGNITPDFWQKTQAGWGKLCFHEETRLQLLQGNVSNAPVANKQSISNVVSLAPTIDLKDYPVPAADDDASPYIIDPKILERAKHIQVAPVEVAGYDSNGIQFSKEAFTPKADPTFTPFGEYKTIDLMIKSKKFFTLYITGDSGCGKNMMVQQACSTSDRPMVRVNFNRDVTEENLIGTKTLKDGNVLAEDGPVTWAAENGAVLVLDELSMSDANKIMCLQNPLEGKPFFAKHANRIITPVPGFCIIATDNTKGKGDSSGRFVGANVLNSAFLERFMYTIEHEYPSKKIEGQILKTAAEHFGYYDEVFVNRLNDLVHVVRNTYKDEGLDEHITTRRAVVILKGYIDFFRKDPTKAIKLSLNRFDDTTRDAIMILWEKLSEGEDIGQNKDVEPDVEKEIPVVSDELAA